MPSKTPRVNIRKLIKSGGRPGERMIDAYTKEERRVDDLRIEDYRRMVDNDGQIQMLFNTITNTIASVGFVIEEDPQWDTSEDSSEKLFVEECLNAPTWQGGMTISLEQTNRTMLRAFIEGYRLFEVVYKLGEDNKIRIDKLAPRAAGTDAGIKVVVDDNGNFKGFHQMINFMGDRIDVKVLNDSEVLKVLKATFGEEFGSLCGRSGLKSAWYHYDKVHKAMFLNHVGHEYGAAKFRYVKTKGNLSEKEVDLVIEELTKIHDNTVFVAPENKMELTFESVSDAAVMQVGKEMINLHYSLIAKSILAQFIDLGSDTSQTGSRALGDSQVKFFKEGLQTTATILIEDPWNQVIASLVKLNFDNNNYPRLKVNSIDNTVAQLLYDALLKLVEKGNVTDTIKKGIMRLGSKRMGIEVTEEELEKEMEQMKNEKQDMMKQQADISKGQNKDKEKKEVKLAEVETSNIRPLTSDEQKVKIVDIKNKLQISDDQAKIILRRKLAVQKNAIVEQYIQAMRAGRKQIRSVKIELSEQTLYSEELFILILEMLEYGKIMAANELKKSVPNTTKKQRAFLQEEVNATVGEQSARLQFRLQSVANEALAREMPENEAEMVLEEEYDTFFDAVLYPMIGIMIPKAFNRGREITFSKYEDDLFAYRYTAVLDNRTTQFCREMDGRVFQRTDPDYVMLSPPNHYGCYDDKTEIYTNNGWRTLQTINSKDLVWSVNPETLEPEWVEQKGILSYEYDGELTHRYNQRVDLMVTDNHMQFVKFREKQKGNTNRDWHLQEDQTLPKHDYHYLKTVKWEGTHPGAILIGDKHYPIMPFVKFMGWYLSEGSTTQKSKNYYQIKISQEKKENIQRILNDIEGIADNIKVWTGGVFVMDPNLAKYCIKFGHAHEKYIPDEIKQLSPRLIRAFLDAYLLGDGSIIKGRIWRDYQFSDMSTYATSSKTMSEDLGELIMKVGKGVSFSLRKDKGKKVKFKNGIYTTNHDSYTIRELRQVFANSGTVKVEKKRYKGMVWDVELKKYHTVLTRRNGKVVWSGNCRSFWTPITNKEQEKYNFRVVGKPEDVPVYSSVNTFRDLNLSEQEAQVEALLRITNAELNQTDKNTTKKRTGEVSSTTEV